MMDTFNYHYIVGSLLYLVSLFGFIWLSDRYRKAR